MSEELRRVAARILTELDDLAQVLARAQAAWHAAEESSDDLYLDSLALNLHALYTGIERLFEMIAATIDGHVPQGSNWHQTLLDQMSHEVPGVRPAVISEPTRTQLDAYRGFRHIVRNIYAYRFDPQKLQILIEQAPDVLGRARAELAAFAAFLDRGDSGPSSAT